MDLTIINDMIDGLEQSNTSLSNIRNLSALYNVKTHLLGTNLYSNTAKELDDILPSYIRYIEVKKKYQLHEISIDTVLIELKNVCKEIWEFINTLYSSTDTPEERELLHKIIDDLKAL